MSKNEILFSLHNHTQPHTMTNTMTNTPSYIKVYTIARNARNIELGFDIDDYYKYKAEAPGCTMNDFYELISEIYREDMEETIAINTTFEFSILQPRNISYNQVNSVKK